MRRFVRLFSTGRAVLYNKISFKPDARVHRNRATQHIGNHYRTMFCENIRSVLEMLSFD